MNPYIKKLRLLLKPKNEDWVVRALKQKQKKPLLIAFSLALGIFLYNFYDSYLVVSEVEDKIQRAKTKGDDLKNKIKKLDQLMVMQEGRVGELRDIAVASKQPIQVLTKVCELLKNRDVIGSFYIIKRQNREFANVLNIEIQISYGDKELLQTIVQIVMDKVFYLKSIKQTKLGVECEIYRPAKK
jgi:hypothetical protein